MFHKSVRNRQTARVCFLYSAFEYSKETEGQSVPMLGTFHSHAGNESFPCWERNIPSVGA